MRGAGLQLKRYFVVSKSADSIWSQVLSSTVGRSRMGEDKTRDPESREVIQTVDPPIWSSNRTNIFPSFSSHCLVSFRDYGPTWCLASFRVYGFMASRLSFGNHVAGLTISGGSNQLRTHTIVGRFPMGRAGCSESRRGTASRAAGFDAAKPWARLRGWLWPTLSTGRRF